MSQYGARKDPPWSQLGVSGAAAGLSQTLLQQQNPSLLGAQPGVGATPTTNIYGQSLVASAGLGGASTTTAYPLQAQTLQQRQTLALQQQQAAAAQNAAAVAAAAGAGAPQLTVSYPTTRGTQGGPPRQRVFTGTVTKLHDTFGFVDEDVFFQTNTVKGSMPKIGDRVLVEATYNASMPFKWNATRIQMLNNQMSEQTVAQQQQQQQLKMHQLKQMPTNQRIEQNITQQFKMLKQSQQPLLKAPQQQAGGLLSSQPQPQGLLSTPPPLLQQPPAAVVQQPALIQQGAQSIQNLAGAYAQANRAGQLGQQTVGRREFGGGSRDRDRDRERERERERAQREREREREREQRERERERERERRERERQRERERSPVRRRSRSPRRSPRRTKRVVQRYMVQIPRFALDIPNADVIELHKRYMSMYIPSDFFMANFSWQDVFPIHRPMNVAQPCTFHIMHKEVPPLGGATSVLDPPDADYFYSAKVMLMASVSQDELYERCCARPQDPSEIRENFQHPTRLINFLVGQKGKNEVMAIGGPWSPSLDGEDPVNDSSVLIKTAIRTTKALTGIDLSSCTQWYRFLELCYHRPEENHKGRVIPARIETVVIFVPDVWHILPTKVEWESVRDDYKKALNSRLSPGDKEPPEGDMSQEEAGEEAEVEKQVPTSWKELDPKNMKVNELRQELDSRGLNSKGLKSQLIARLTKTLKSEQENEDAEAEAMEMEGGGEEGPGGNAEETSTPTKASEEKEKEEEEDKKEEKKEEKKDEEKKKELGDEEKRRRDEREKRDLEQRYQLPESPAIVVHPSATAKNGKFDCVLTSLSVLLDYRVEDNKEHSFEVSLFAELFNEMMQRDFAFNIFKALYKAPEKKEEKKEKDDKKKDKDKKDEKDKKEDRDEPKMKKRKVDDKDGDRDADKDRDKDEDRSERKEDDTKDDDRDGEEEDNEGRSADEEEDDDDRKKDDKRSDDEKRKSRRVKVDTFDSALLLSCVYFDQNHCGYILERDLEEILYTIGLHLSRAQVRKLLQKVVTRDSWNYRKFTDGPKKEKDEVSKLETNGFPSDEELGKGNHFLKESMIDAKKMKRGSSLDGPNMVSYGGSVVDIANLLNQVHKADQERLMAQKKIEQLEKQIDVLKNKATSTEATVSNVSGELHDVQKRLVSSERALSTSNSRSKKLMDVVGSAQKSLDEVMLKFNEVLEESLAAVKTEKVKEEKVKIKTEIKEEK